ncbi:MAG: hypothetical protein ACE366_00300 [Bradymonadia bacterium]
MTPADAVDLKALVQSLLGPDEGEQALPSGRAGAGLASMLDPAGGVQLAEALSHPPLPLATSAISAYAPDTAQVERQIRRGLDALERRLRRTFDDAFKARYRLPGPSRCLDLLQESGALSERNAKGKPLAKALKKACRTLWAPFGAFIETQYKRARFDLRQLRDDLGAALRARGGDAARLEHLDGLLREAIRVEGERRYRRLLHALEQRFATQIEALATELTAQATVHDLEPAFGDDGPFAELVRLGRSVVFSVMQHERALLEGLMNVVTPAYDQRREGIH